MRTVSPLAAGAKRSFQAVLCVSTSDAVRDSCRRLVVTDVTDGISGQLSAVGHAWNMHVRVAAVYVTAVHPARRSRALHARILHHSCRDTFVRIAAADAPALDYVDYVRRRGKWGGALRVYLVRTRELQRIYYAEPTSDCIWAVFGST